jgi:hypothetical protein
MTTFADYAQTKKGRSAGCRRCGADKNAGAITVSLQQLTDKGQLHGPRLGSRSRSLCEPCAIEVYEHLLAVFDEQIKPKVA